MPSELLVGQTLLSQYRLDAWIASTPLGEYYLAWDTWRNKPMGVTILPQKISEDADAIKQLNAEANTLDKITHPNLVAYHGVLQTPTSAFLLEDWVDGPSLRDAMDANIIGVNEALVYIKAVCDALAPLHKNKYIHLSLTPDMIRVNARGEIFLCGIGGCRREGEKGFSRESRVRSEYEAPEQIYAQPISPATDVYSLAAIVYRAITGEPFQGKNPNALNAEIPDHFSRMLMWALREDETRLSNTTELLSTLALAAKFNANDVPLRATLETAPVTDALIRGWSFLPPAQPNIIAADMPPLEERLAAVAPPPKKKRSRSWIGFAVAASFIALFVFVLAQIQPVEEPVVIIPTQPTKTPMPTRLNYPPTPTNTPVPKPTSTHGGRIIFTCTRGDYNQMCLINADGTGYQRISNQLANDYYPSFQPGGGGFVFASNRNGGVFDLYLFLFEGNKLFQLTNNIGNVVSPDFSPGGQKIVFANQSSTGPISIWIVNRDGTNPRLIYTGKRAIVAVAWSPDGEKIAYAMSVDSPTEYEIFTMNTDGTDHRRITHGLLGIGGSVDWSPDGKSILVYAGPLGDKDIFQVNVETGKFTQLTYGGNNAAANYSPDGQFIVFNSLRNDDQADLYIIRSDGSDERQLTNDPEPDWQARWEP